MTGSHWAEEARAFFDTGWVRFPHDPAIDAWRMAAKPISDALANDPGEQSRWLRSGGTWYAGVNAFPNDAAGAVPDRGVPPLSGAVLDFIADALDLTPDPAAPQPPPFHKGAPERPSQPTAPHAEGFGWDRAQISVCYPGYPQQAPDETDAAFRFRRNRDAAHVDGLTRHGPENRRHLGEPHGFILGIPLGATDPESAPMIVYEGSHQIMRAAFSERLADIPPESWRDEDLTEAYTAARRQCFQDCPRVPVHAQPGDCYLVHRLALHGVAPWTGGTEPRAIAYFRPDPHLGAAPGWWLDTP
ncbi:MAG: hypothetical protein AAGB15_06620 [Pseudomonadota bacterium]